MSLDWLLSFSRYGDHWRAQRRTFHQYFHPKAVEQYKPIELKCTRTLLRQLLEEPAEHREHLDQ